MGMGGGGGRDKIQSDINVTPLVDVCLVLLIIFMVVTPLLQNGVSVQLPQTDNPDKKPEGDKQKLIVGQLRDPSGVLHGREAALQGRAPDGARRALPARPRRPTSSSRPTSG